MRQVERRVAVAQFLQVHQHRLARGRDQEVARVRVEGDQALRTGHHGRRHALRQVRQPRLHRPGRCGWHGGMVQIAGLRVDERNQSGQGILFVEQWRARFRQRHGQRVDRGERLHDGHQMARLAGRRAHDLLHQQRAPGHAGRGRDHAVQQRNVPRRCGALKAGALVEQVLRRGQVHLALFGNARKPPGSGQPHMPVGQAFVRQRLQATGCRDVTGEVRQQLAVDKVHVHGGPEHRRRGERLVGLGWPGKMFLTNKVEN
ncbi:hypothetical protein FQZ97_758060 [compost metagenome]